MQGWTDSKLTLENYLMNTMQIPPPRPVVVIISGPSGVGKDAVVARLKERRENLYFVVTATSR